MSFAVAGTAAAAPPVGSFQKRASSPQPVNNVAVDPTTNMIYAQQFEGKGFYRYNPRTNKWTTLAKAPINQGNNGGAAYVKGKIYTVYTENEHPDGGVRHRHRHVVDDHQPSGGWAPGISPLTWALLYLVDGTDFISYDPATDTTQTLATPPFSFDAVGWPSAIQGRDLWAAGRLQL